MIGNILCSHSQDVYEPLDALVAVCSVFNHVEEELDVCRVVLATECVVLSLGHHMVLPEVRPNLNEAEFLRDGNPVPLEDITEICRVRMEEL